VDLDGDGHLDILSGSYSRMDKDMAGLFQVLYGNKDGTFRKAEVLKGTDGEPLIISGDQEKELTEKICTRPFATDWNGDGKLDLVVGTFRGTLYLFVGEGKGKFDPKPTKMTDKDGKILRVPGVHSDPFVIDWDGDGALDIVSGSSDAGVYWARNTAGKGKPPTLEPFVALVKPNKKEAREGEFVAEESLKAPTYASRVWVADINGDGKLDLLVGDSVTLLAPAKGVTPEEYKKRLAAWSKEFEEAGKSLDKVKDEKEREKASKRYSELYQERSKFMNEEMTGYVWLYLQK
jgi:hypothetical protein